MVEARTPTLAKIKNEASETDARALLYIAVCEVCDFFNVGKNMNDLQIGITVDLVLESFWYFKLEEIKYCFRRAMAREKLFDRLDGNIILGWLRDYDEERTKEAMRISEQRESQEVNEHKENPGAVTFREYMAALEEKARTDKDAAKRLKEINELPAVNVISVSREDRERKTREFQMWKQFNYLLNKDK